MALFKPTPKPEQPKADPKPAASEAGADALVKGKLLAYALVREPGSVPVVKLLKLVVEDGIVIQAESVGSPDLLTIVRQRIDQDLAQRMTTGKL